MLTVLLLAPVIAHAQERDTVTVTWTAPGDDAGYGTATQYELRYSEEPINSSNFGDATPVSGMPVPRAAGQRQSVVVRGLTYGTTYYFAIRTRDDEGNWSGLSNIARWDWTSPPPPGPTPTAAMVTASPGYPNPSRLSDPVRIPVQVNSGTADVVVDIVDSGGRRVRRIELGSVTGTQEVVWDGKNDDGRGCAPGPYQAWLISGKTRQSVPLVRVP
jgi:hypothetical protein